MSTRGSSPYATNWVPYLLVAPQLAVTIIFFLWPAGQALWQSMLLQDPFGQSVEFVWFDNFKELFADDTYLQSFKTTVVFSVLVSGIGLTVALFFAALADFVIKGSAVYRTLLIWPYAIAPVVAAVLWMFLLNPSLGVVTHWLRAFGYTWDHMINGGQAMTLVVIASVWKQISYNFVFFFAALQSIPRSLIEAAAIDGAGPIRRFFSIVFPLISPTSFFLLVVNMVYAFFDTFAIIDASTGGGPAKATEILVYKVFQDGFRGLDLGGSAAQSVILMAIVITLTIIQFRYVERKVVY